MSKNNDKRVQPHLCFAFDQRIWIYCPKFYSPCRTDSCAAHMTVFNLSNSTYSLWSQRPVRTHQQHTLNRLSTHICAMLLELGLLKGRHPANSTLSGSRIAEYKNLRSRLWLQSKLIILGSLTCHEHSITNYPITCKPWLHPCFPIHLLTCTNIL